jgi:iron complex outermembrane recepter protein
MKLKQNLLLVFFLFITLGLFAQSNTIRGTVKDAKDSGTLPGASVKVKGTNQSTITDIDGKFSITLKKEGAATLVVSYVGYRTQEVAATDGVTIEMDYQVLSADEVVVSASRVEEALVKAAVTVEKITTRNFQNSASINPFDVLQGVKGVDLLTQSLTFKSVNLRGFGANNNNRFVQLTDGMDNRSPGLGFGFGTAAGISDLDVQSIELLPGASSALYGPDALQGLMLTKSKNPFQTQGLSATVKAGVNNVGSDEFDSPTPYTDVAIRYAKAITSKLAFKVNFQRIDGTDFVANNYDDRSHRGRPGFFNVDKTKGTVSLGFKPNNDSNDNLQYDGVNIYGDDFTNSGSFNFTAANTTNTALQGKTVTRTGYKEIDLIGNNGKIFNNRASAALHYKLTDKVEASVVANYGGGNFIRTGPLREYFPNYNRLQLKAEVASPDFFVRAYRTTQEAEFYSLGNLAARLNQMAKPTAAWAADFDKAYAVPGTSIDAARAAADNKKFAVGSAAFNTLKDSLINTNSNVAVRKGINGVRFFDNSSMTHTEAMYNLSRHLPKNLEVVAGASYRYYQMETKGTVFPVTRDTTEFTIKEYGAYTQASYNIELGDNLSIKPTAGVRYDKNEYFKGGFTPRLSVAANMGQHNLRASWQSAFRNPSANQLLADGQILEVGGSREAVTAANLFNNKAYTEASVTKFRTSGNVADLVAYEPNPDAFTTEKIQTWEVGYKTLIGNRLFVDAFYYNSVYNDFIATQNYVQPTTGIQADVKNTVTSKTYQINFNNFNEIFVSGYGVGLEFAIAKGFVLTGNYANQVGKVTLKDALGNIRKDGLDKEIVKRKMSNPEVAAADRNFFISPEHRFNIGIGNSKLTDKIGFSVNYRWTDEMWVEQGNTQGDIWLPSWTSLDAQVTYRVPKIKTSIKLGATNLLNKYYSQGYGLAQIGGMYYVGLTYNPADFR